MQRYIAIAGAILIVAAIIGFAGYTIVLEFASAPPPRFLLLGDVQSKSWQRIARGAQTAALFFKANLDVKLLSSDKQSEEQAAAIRQIDFSKYQGVVLHSDASAAHLDIINELAEHSKLITTGEDPVGSKRLCHVAFSDFQNGKEAARTVRAATQGQSATVLIVSSNHEPDDEFDADERLKGFQQEWSITEPVVSRSNLRFSQFAGRDLHDPTVMQDVSNAFADRDLDAIVAIDRRAAECVLAIRKELPSSRYVPLFALDANEETLDAIEGGRMYSTVVNDPFFCGYEAVRRLKIYASKSEPELPRAGRGETFLTGETILKPDIPALHARTGLRDSFKTPFSIGRRPG